MLPITEQQAAASAHSGLHGSAKMENPTKAIRAKLRTIIANRGHFDNGKPF
jgi:hypothetical protein